MIYGMLYATAVGLPILLAAIVWSGPLRRGGRPERGVWLAALGLALTLPVALLMSPASSTSSGSLVAGGSVPLPETGVIGLPEVVAVPVGQSGMGVDEVVLFAWLLASVLLALRWAIAAYRLAGAGASWRTETVDGVSACVTDNLGPAVSGVFRPRILVPSWLASLPHQQRSLVLLHEQEHVRARDPMLIAVSRIARILAPWNPFVWLLSSRLVRAVELDCDRRVLRRRPDVEAYGTTLLTVSSREPSRLAAATAFAESEAPLRKRILAMTTPPRAISVLGILTALVLGVVFLVGVFEVPIPAIRIQVDMEPSGSGVAIVEEEPATEVVGTIFSQASLISVRFNDTPINDVLDVFAAFTERSIVASESFTELVTADINREPWDVALGTILAARGLVASTGEDGVIRVDRRAARVGTVTGEVTDAQSGVSVRAAQVFISDLRLGGLSQRNGRYLLQNVPAGTHTLSVTRMGYRTVEAQITVRGGQTVVQGFSIAEEALQLEPLIVTGTAGGTTRRSTPADLENLDPDDVESVEVLSPAAALARYGVRAAAGLVQIRTKR